MSLWIIDTDHISLLQRGHPVVTQRINQVNTDEIAVTIITAEEQLRGRLDFIRKASAIDELVSAYARLRDTLKDYKSINLLDFNHKACSC